MKFLRCKKIVLLVLTVAIVLCGSGCHIRSDAERFDAYVEQIFQQMMSGNTLNLNYFLANPENYGIDPGSVGFGSVMPDMTELEESGMSWEESVDAQIESMEFLFDYEELTPQQQVLYDQLIYYLESTRNYEGLEYYEDYCLGSGSVVTNLPLMLAEFHFRTKKDIETYLDLLNTYDTFFNEIIKYEKEKSKQGLFMTDASLDAFQKNCDSFLSSGEKNVLLLSFEDKIHEFEGLDEKTVQDYIARNKKIVETVVMPAYQKLFKELGKLRGTGKNTGGVCNFPAGKQYYEFLAAQSVGSDMSVSQMYTALGAAMNEMQLELQGLLEEDPALEQKMMDFSFDKTEPYEILEYLKEVTKEDYPAIPEVNYTVKSIAEYLNNTNVVAFYIVSPIDDMQNQIIYTNDTKNFAGAELFTTLAHEGYPGHLYQTVFFANTKPNPVGYLLGTTGYQEGWATYVEHEIYGYCGIEDETLVRALQLNSGYNLLFNAYIDIAINYQGMDFSSFYTMIQAMSLEEEAARDIYRGFTEDPAVYLPYAIGFLEFMELRETAEETLGSDFVLKEFHETVLELGAVPFPLLEKHVEAWLQVETVAEAA